MIENVVNYLKKENLYLPAKKQQIEAVQNKLNFTLPEQYSNFLLQSNGYEGSVGNSYLVLWKIEELIELNEGYAVSEFALHLIIIGSNGAGEAFAFDVSKDEHPIVNTPFIGLGMDEKRVIGNSFNEFILKISEGMWDV